MEEGSFSVVGDEGQLDPGVRPAAGYVGVCLHGSESHFPSNLVYMNFESIDVEKSPMCLLCWRKVVTALVIAVHGQLMQRRS